MLDWLMGTTRSADSHFMSNGDSESFLEDPPETPAPVFAVRAFKSALFGTPHPAQPTSPSNRFRKAVSQNLSPKASTLPSEPLKTVHLEPKDGENVTQKLEIEALVSPTKGILLTPGIGTTRRKNVTFRGIGSGEKSKAKDGSKGSLLCDTLSDASLSRSQAATVGENQPRQTSLTKALYKARDGISPGNIISSPNLSSSNGRVAREREYDHPVSPVEKEGNDHNVATDLTIDLSNPHSRSGQHWKAEWEQYHKNSDREMKEILKISQNAKAFAAKKDSEASDLIEKLQRESSRAAEMERKVIGLARQLAATKTHDSKETPDQAKIVNELTRQTALAVGYQQKADNYKTALMKRNKSLALDVDRLEDNILQQKGAKLNQSLLDPISSDHLKQDMASLRSELARFRSNAEATERKATKLEAENLVLQAEIGRLRHEIKISESKRQARKEILHKREVILKASNTDGNAHLLTLSTQKEAVSQDVQQNHKSSPSSEGKISQGYNGILSNQISQEKVVTGKTISDPDHPKHSKDTDTYDADSSILDILILEGQNDTLPPVKPRKKRNLVKHPPKVLKEITQNRVLKDENRKPYRTTQNSVPSPENPPLPKIQPEHESPRLTTFLTPKKVPTSETKQIPARRQSTNSSPYPSMPNSASNPPEPVSSTGNPTPPVMNSAEPQKRSKSSINGSTPTKSTFNQGIGVIAPTSTEAEVRKGSEMPALIDRKAVMKARHEERMATKKKAREGKGREA